MEHSAQVKPLHSQAYRAWLNYQALPQGGSQEIWRTLMQGLALILAPGAPEAQGLLQAHLASKRPGFQTRPKLRGKLKHSLIVNSALEEVQKGLQGLLLEAPRLAILGEGGVTQAWDTFGEAFGFSREGSHLLLWARADQGLLYGVFHLLATLASGEGPEALPAYSQASSVLRKIDHWDNMDGSVERGYAGSSLFFEKGGINLHKNSRARLKDYARLLASQGINALCINNVNVHKGETLLISDALIPRLARLAGIFRAWGIRLFLSINYAAPMSLGGLESADPLDPGVGEFWTQRARALWQRIPDLGGFVVKADSEGRPGPFSYGRDHAQGANVLARALAPYGAWVVWRCFVYNCKQDWRDRSIDRARAAYDNFMPLDGQFLPNVILQIKHGPMDFQVREPINPLILGLQKTKILVEVQITQEYTGQQRHLCYLGSPWKNFLSQEIGSLGSLEARLRMGPQQGGIWGLTGVANVGGDENWTGHYLAQANLFAFGQLAWDPRRSNEAIVQRWIAQSLGDAPTLKEHILPLMLASWEAYESYTSPLGIGWMVEPQHHYGPSVNGYEYSPWGTYHYADHQGIGVARSQARGSGYTSQYPEALQKLYEDPQTCPEELILFFHHLPWKHRLPGGKTIIQHIYDSHFDDLEQARKMQKTWEGLQAELPPAIYEGVKNRFEEQVRCAREWCDQVNSFCHRMSDIPDEGGRRIF